MRARSVMAAVGLCASIAPLAQTQPPAQLLPFEKLAAECVPGIHPMTLKAVVRTESSWNPYAIGVVGGRLERQPRSLPEAVATARELERQGFNFSMGLGQVNRHNLPKYGETYETVFEPCRNFKASGAILTECFQRAKRTIGDEQIALRAALSCYYSGNFTRGFRPDRAGEPSYVQKVVANATGQERPIPVVPAIQPQSPDGTAPVRATNRPAAATKPAQTHSQWVIFADITRESSKTPEQALSEPAKEAAVKVRLETQDRDAGPSSSEEQAPMQRKAQTPPTQATVPSSDKRDIPFVQFVN